MAHNRACSCIGMSRSGHSVLRTGRGKVSIWSHFTRWYILTQWSTITLKSVLISLILHRFPQCDVPLESWQAALSNNDTFSIPEITVYILYTKELLMLRSFWSVPRHMLMWTFTKHNQGTTLLQIWLNFTCFILKVLLLLVISRPPKQYFTSRFSPQWYSLSRLVMMSPSPSVNNFTFWMV